MKSFSFKNSNSSSKDAMTFAPCFCSASDFANVISLVDIALAVSILFCIYFAFSALGIIIILSIITLSALIFRLQL